MVARGGARARGGRARPGDTVLDVGAGLGLLTLAAHDRIGDGWVIAVDPSVGALEELLRLAHEANANGIMYLVGDAEVLPLPDASSTSAVLRSVLVHVADTGARRGGARARAAPGGRLSLREPLNRARTYLSTAVDWSPLGALGERVDALWEEVSAADPLQRLDADALAAALAAPASSRSSPRSRIRATNGSSTEESADARLDARGGPGSRRSASAGRPPSRPAEVERPRRAPATASPGTTVTLPAPAALPQRPPRLSAAEEVSAPSRTRHRRARIRSIPSLQGPSRPPGGSVRRERDTFRRDDLTGCRGGRSCSGSRRSGQAAALALARRGVEVVAADRSPDADAGRLAEAGVEVRLGSEEESLLDGVELVVKSPGVPAESPLAAAARARGDPDLERGRARLPAAPRQPAHRRHRDEREDDDDRAARRDPPRRRAARSRSPGNVGRALTDVAERDRAGHDRSSASSRASSSRTCTRSRATSPCCSTSSPTTSTGTARFEAYRDAKLRIFERARAKIVPRGFGLDGIEFAADDPLPAEPLIPGAHNRENAAAATAAARAAGVGDDAIAEALRTFAGVAHRLELVRELRRRPLRQRLEGDEHRGRAPRRRRLRRAAAPDPRRLAQGRGLRAARARAACERPLDLSDRRGDRRARRSARRRRALVLRATATSRTRSRTRTPTPSPATSSCSRRPPRASTSSRTSRSAATRSGGSSRSSHEPPHEAALARVAAARARADRDDRVRARHGLQRDVRVGRARARQPDRLPRAAERLRVPRHRADDRRLAHRLPQAAPRSRRRSSSRRSASARPCS